MTHKSKESSGTPGLDRGASIEAFGGGLTFYVESDTPGIVYDVELVAPGGDLISFSVRRLGPDAPPLTARLLREATLESVVMGVRRELEEEKTTLRPFGSPLKAALQMLDPRGEVDWKPRRPGRPSRSDLEVALIARQYVDAVLMLGGNGAADHVGGELGLAKATVLGILNGARRRGLLSEAPKGRPGGTLTDTALALLDNHEKGN